MKVSARQPRFVPWVILLALSGFVLVERASVPQQPYGADSMAYAVIGHELMAGRPLYADLWDHKPPAIFVTYMFAEAVVGYGPQMLLLLNVAATSATLLGTYWAGRFQGEATGLWAASLWAILSGSHVLEGREPNTEVFINACLVWAFALLIRAERHALGVKRSAVVGCLFALGSFYKPVVIAGAAPLAFVHLLSRPRESENRRHSFIDVCVMCLVGLAGWCALWGYFAATGRSAAFWDAMVTYNSYYSGDPLSNLIAPLGGREVVPDYLNPLALSAVVGVALTLWASQRAGALLVAYMISAWLMVALPGQFYSHYYQLWLPPLVLGAGFLVVSAARFLRPGAKWVPHAAASLLSVLFLVKELPYYRMARAGAWDRMFNAQQISAAPTARRIDSLLIADETFFVWGGGAGPYFWSRRRPPTGVLYTHHLNEGPLAARLSARVAEDLLRERPELLLVSTSEARTPGWVTEDYLPIQAEAGNSAFKFYARRDGRLLRR